MSIKADLGPPLEDFVASLVREGRFRSRDEALQEGVRLLEMQEKRLSELDAAIAEGISDAEAGRVTASADMRAHFRAKRQGAVTRTTR
ncbi:antitoxin ParD1/3/4 [Neorhizobium galegae]|uniref:type II toxin-antitoxin system ParD family antitoxin n=1 Tax=Neorhizobium galegae TaxID=399 RepID=UPI001AE46E9A|nr:type II toxin-antitoxin system ParD family antitoxin [Neorhizobium galegae]MBP2547566.1 antitoxin ParD1/3/4 [Neorhizobium galegae]